MMGVFSRAAKGRMLGDRFGKVSKEAHSAKAIKELLLSLLTRQVKMLKAWVGAAQAAKGLAEEGREPLLSPTSEG